LVSLGFFLGLVDDTHRQRERWILRKTESYLLNTVMSTLHEEFSIWMHRDFSLTAERYTETSQTLTIRQDGMCELRWVDYSQGSALEEKPGENLSVITCLVGRLEPVRDCEYKFVLKNMFKNCEDSTQELKFEEMVIMVNDNNTVSVMNPLISDPRFNTLSKVS
jgi:hypothetical protein